MSMQVGESGDEDTPMSDINTTPLVDVMLVMLIIFLITVPVIRQTIDVRLPKVAFEPTITKPENVNLTVRAVNGQCEVYWNLTRVNSQQLLDRAVASLEALIMTAVGLIVAVPAVMQYNWLMRRNRAIGEELARFANDVHGYMMSGGAVRPSVQAARPAATRPPASAAASTGGAASTSKP